MGSLVALIDRLDVAPGWKTAGGVVLAVAAFLLNFFSLIDDDTAQTGYLAGGAIATLGVGFKINRRFVPPAAVLALALLLSAQPASAFNWREIVKLEVSFVRVDVSAANMMGIWVSPARFGCYIPGVSKISFLGCTPETVTTQPAVPVVVEDTHAEG